MSNIYISTPSHILWCMPQGKPDPRIPCERGTIYQRPLVIQSPQKGPSCWYYALGMLRDRIGKEPAEDFFELRKIEIAVSKRRKYICLHRKQWEEDKAIVSQVKIDPNYTKYKMWTRNGAAVNRSEARVYFVEPFDGSDPVDLEKQAIYTISYTDFIKHIGNLVNQIIFDSPQAKERGEEIVKNEGSGNLDRRRIDAVNRLAAIGFCLHGPKASLL